jgi:N-acetylglucosamine kinase-like BadF-type ATPase
MTKIPILAIDAGGTKCRAILCEKDGTIVSYVKGPPCNLHNIGIEGTVHTLTKVLNQLTKHLSKPLNVGLAVVGMAALDTQKDIENISRVVSRVLQDCHINVNDIVINNDGIITLLGVLGDSPGLLVISGTGSIICGKNEQNQFVRVGGWGYRLGDEGSGYFIGQSILRSIFQAKDRGISLSPMANRVLQMLQLNSLDELLAWTYSKHYSVDKVASLAKIAFSFECKGDQTAKNILNQAAQDLAEMCHTAIERLNLTNKTFDVIFSGGILQNNISIANKFAKILKNHYKSIKIVNMEGEPIIRAFQLGLRILKGHSKDAVKKCTDLLAKLESSKRDDLL